MRPSLLRRIRAIHRAAPEERSLGQSLVEFALTLPVILFLTLVALDFGRVYLGYINLQNMSRIAANFAANHPNAWGSTLDPNWSQEQTQYRTQILADASAINCRLPQSSGVAVVPAPVFTDVDSDGNSNHLGDRVTVQISCTFDVITPGISNVLGGTVAVSAESNFPVKSGVSYVDGATSGAEDPILPNAAFTGNDILSSHSPGDVILSDTSPFTVVFRDTSGGVPTQWDWDFGDGTTSSVTNSDPISHVFSFSNPACDPTATSCTFRVVLTASNANGYSKAYMDITVIGSSLVAFTADKTTVRPNINVNFTDKSTPGGTTFEWDFNNDGVVDSTSENPSHAYSSEGIKSVKLKVTYPSPTGVQSLTKTSYINVSWGVCQVPSLTAMRFNDADAVYRGAPYNFTGHVVRQAGAPSGNFLILIQSLTATSYAPCNWDIEVTTP